MDHVPSQAADSSGSAFVLPTTESASGARVKPRGIHQVVTDFAEIFDEIAVAVKSVMPARVEPADWEDLFQDVVVEAVVMHAKNPECFVDGSPTHWARRVAKNKRFNKRRAQRKHVIRDEALARLVAAGVFRAKTPDEELEDKELNRAIIQVFDGLKPEHRVAAEAYFVDGLKRREAAAVGSITERALKRVIENIRRLAPLALKDWLPGLTTSRRPSRAAAKPATPRGTDDDQRS
jgi:RNA polymerase sigma factor (sigma-70 family)